MNDEELKYYSMPKLQKKFVEMMGEWQTGDWYHIGNMNSCIGGDMEADNMNEYHPKDYLRLPLPIDPENPERGLTGILKSTLNKYQILRWSVGYSSCHVEILEPGGLKQIAIYYADTPTLALLKALARQEGARDI